MVAPFLGKGWMGLAEVGGIGEERKWGRAENLLEILDPEAQDG